MPTRVLGPKLVLVVLLAMSGCHRASPTSATDAGAADAGRGPSEATDCRQRKGGAEIAIKVNDETFRLWSTNATFIEHALRLQRERKQGTPLFKVLRDGKDCDPRATFHVDPSQMEWSAFTIEVCDGRPSDIERDKLRWFNDVKRWCPWNSLVTEIEDRRDVDESAR